MTIILMIVGLVVMGFILGFVTRSPEINCPHWDYDFKFSKMAGLEMRVFELERENDRLNHIYRSLETRKRCFEESYAAHCHFCNKNFYAPTPKEQEVADMLKNITLTSEEIAKKLGFDVPKL